MKWMDEKEYMKDVGRLACTDELCGRHALWRGTEDTTGLTIGAKWRLGQGRHAEEAPNNLAWPSMQYTTHQAIGTRWARRTTRRSTGAARTPTCRETRAARQVCWR